MGDAGKVDHTSNNKRDRSSPEDTHTKKIRRENSHREMEAKIDKLINAVNALTGSVDAVKAEMKEMKDAFAAKEAKWDEEKAGLIVAVKQLEERVDYMERDRLRNKAILTGVQLTHERASGVVREMLSKLPKPVTPSEISSFTTKAGITKVRVCFANHEDKMSVLRERKMLTVTDEKGASTPVYINDDQTKKDQFISFQARKFAKEERAKGNEVKLGFRKIVVNGKPMLFDEQSNTFNIQKN